MAKKYGPSPLTGLYERFASIEGTLTQFNRELWQRLADSSLPHSLEPGFLINPDDEVSMTEQEWLTSTSCYTMFSRLMIRKPSPSERKCVLYARRCCELAHLSTVTNTFGDPYKDPDLEKKPNYIGTTARQWAKNWTVDYWADITPGNLRVSKEARADLLRDLFGNPFRPVPFPCGGSHRHEGEDACGTTRVKDCNKCQSLFTWNGGVILTTARRMYDTGDFGDIPVLADMLEEAGCDNEEILMHLRGIRRCPECWMTEKLVCGTCTGTGFIQFDAPHVRGCWVVDLLLAKE